MILITLAPDQKTALFGPALEAQDTCTLHAESELAQVYAVRRHGLHIGFLVRALTGQLHRVGNYAVQVRGNRVKTRQRTIYHTELPPAAPFSGALVVLCTEHDTFIAGVQ